MNGIIVRKNESMDKAISRFSRFIDDLKTLSEFRQYSHYEKPSEKRNRIKQDIKRRRKNDYFKKKY